MTEQSYMEQLDELSTDFTNTKVEIIRIVRDIHWELLETQEALAKEKENVKLLEEDVKSLMRRQMELERLNAELHSKNHSLQSKYL